MKSANITKTSIKDQRAEENKDGRMVRLVSVKLGGATWVSVATICWQSDKPLSITWPGHAPISWRALFWFTTQQTHYRQSLCNPQAKARTHWGPLTIVFILNSLSSFVALVAGEPCTSYSCKVQHLQLMAMFALFVQLHVTT